jgi:DNA ligase-1
MIKPMLACDADLSAIKFPVFAQPKIDGVRALNLDGNLTGRSLKPHGNRFVTEFFSKDVYRGFDGEMFVGPPYGDDACRMTTSALSSHEGEPEVNWAVFDYITEETIDLPYDERLTAFHDYFEKVSSLLYLPMRPTIRVWPIITQLVESIDHLEMLIETWAGQGYEGVIVRAQKGLYKQGRSTIREGGLLRIKKFQDSEAKVLEIIEGNSNQNQATTNALGYTERNSRQEGMIPNGMVGALICRDIKSEQIITLAAGKLTQAERKFYFENPNRLIGQIVKYKFFPKGIKDKPRFPTFQSIRMKSDILSL